MLNVLIVDDSSLMRRVIARALQKYPDIKVIASAENGELGVAAVRKHHIEIDVVILDIEMPVMDGITALIEIRKLDRRLPVIMFSSLTQRGTESTIRALTSGASDYVGKPANMNNAEEALHVLEEALVPKIKALGDKRRAYMTGERSKLGEIVGKGTRSVSQVDVSDLTLAPTIHKVQAICLGVSTGGPTALATLFENWVKPLPVPLFIVQHMPPRFTEMLANRLSELGPTEVEEAFDGQVPKPGHAYIAPGGWHMVLQLHHGKTHIQINDLPPENSCRPSVDMLFRSAADIYKNKLLGVVMTGMGSDGLLGSKNIVDARGSVIAQDQDSSTIWGMPGAVVNARLASGVFPLEKLSSEILRYAEG